MERQHMHHRKATDRGRVDLGWLDSHHSFSFGHYHDPRFRGFSDLLVINDDRVQAGGGFPTHPHRDMEIISYVVGGALSHKDTLGNGSTIRPGDVQLMGAGRGIAHSEYNSGDGPLRFLQIWILPEHSGTAPRYAEAHFQWSAQTPVQLVVSKDGAEGSLRIDQDMRLYRARFLEQTEHRHTIAPGRYAWLQVVTGEARVGDVMLREGDGLAFDTAGDVSVSLVPAAESALRSPGAEAAQSTATEYLWFDLRGKGPHPWH